MQILNRELSKIIITFDDGRFDNYDLIKVLEKNNLCATFNITTGYIDNTIPDANRPCPNLPLTFEQLSEMADNECVEISGHGDNHMNTLIDIISGVEKLRKWFPRRDICGIASPNCNITEDEISRISSDLSQNGIKYFRIGLKNKNKTSTKFMVKLSMLLKSKLMFYLCSRNSIKKINGGIVYSIPIYNRITLNQVTYLIKKTIKREKDIVLMFHSVIKKGDCYHDDLWSWDYDKFVKLCEYISRCENEKKLKSKKLCELC